MSHTAYIAMGSNIGDRAAQLHAAMDAMSSYLAIEETSHLYETVPMMVTEQPMFLNAVCRATTTLKPLELLRALKQTEVDLGRAKTIRYGPRAIDLDIIFYDKVVMDTPELTIPHLHIAERDFVLVPLLDLNPDLYHPQLGCSVWDLWQQLKKPVPLRVMPVGGRLWHWGDRPRVMGIINMTPDSFSGDGLFNEPDPLAAALERGRRFVANGADVLDIGGYSTRPGHLDMSVEEEICRVVPVISALRESVDVPLSIDTFRAEVAQEALDAGACWLNDVSGLRSMLVANQPPSQSGEQAEPAGARGLGALASCRRVPLVVVHNRAPLYTRGHSAVQQFVPPTVDIVADVSRELAASLELARRHGVARWHRIIDPGIGFGKKLFQQTALIARLHELQRLGYPMLFGASRKGFLGQMTNGTPVDKRMSASIAVNVLAVERGAQIVRVHDVYESVQALQVVNAIVQAYQQ